MILPGFATGARSVTPRNGTRMPVSDIFSTVERTSAKCWITQSERGYGQVGFGMAANASVTSTTSSPTATPILFSLKRQSFIGGSSMASSSSAAEFAQQPELLVHRTIRITEDDGVLARSDGPLAPAGNDDDVVRADPHVSTCNADLGFAFQPHEDSAVGRTVRPRRESSGVVAQHGTDRRHRPATRNRVHVPQAYTEVRVGIGRSRQDLDGFARARVRVAEQR